MFRFICLCLLVTAAWAENKATVKLSGTENVEGVITFTEIPNGILIEGEVKHLTPGKHGFHVHSLGDLSNGCLSTGSHFNPKGQTHGAPSDKVRHVGDLGNIVADENGVAKIHFTDNVIALHGENNILGRAIVVHVGEDDLGKGGNKDSLTTGNAGGRVACGVIGIL